MRYGDKDGFNEIYDDNGELVLHPNEKALVVEENVVPTFKSTWRYYGGDYLLEPSKGTMYLTNERMVFINIPERMFAIGGEEARAIGSSVEKNFELGALSTGATSREYFEIPNIEVMASERKEGAVSVGEMVNVYVLSSGNQYHLSMVLPSDSDLLKRLMNKKVSNLDQLVNNLKDYFQKDDWMFTEAEKGIYVKPAPKEPKMDIKPETREPDVPFRPKPAAAPRSEIEEMMDLTIPKRRMHDGPESGSVRYFITLYRKGLIREEIFRRLMGQYGIDPAPLSLDQGRYNAPIQRRKIVAPASGPKPEASAILDEPGTDEEQPVEGDEELLNMLDDTLSDFSDDADEAEPVNGAPDTPPSSDDEQ